MKTLHESIDRLSSTANDWAPWDETYNFVRGKNSRYVDDNLTETALSNLGLSLVAYFDRSGSVVWARAYDLLERKIVPEPPDFRALSKDDLLFRHADIRSGATGLIGLSGNRIMLVASRPITSSDFSAPSVGTLVMGRMLDHSEIGRISLQATIDLDIVGSDEPGLSPDFASARSRLAAESRVYVVPLDGERVAGYALLDDIYGKPAAVLRVISPRGIYKQGLSSFGFLMLSVGLASLFSSVLVVYLIELLILRRLSRLGTEITRIGATRDLRARVEIRGDDELSSLAGIVNATLSELEAADRGLKASLSEKEMLLREIHHRVKNNLQVVSSLLSLQSGNTADSEARSALKESQGRIQTMALIHEFLYRDAGHGSPDLARVGFREYLCSLSSFQSDAYSGDQSRISIEIAENEVYLDADAAITCGLIVNELISNSMKHAFPGGRRGRISIGIRSVEEGEVSIFVNDDGIGFPPGFDLSRAGSMGWQLIATLVRQLNGRIEIGGGAGSSVAFRFYALRA